MFVKCLVKAYRLACHALGPELFAEAAGVIGDEAIGRVENVFSRAVVLLEFDQLRTREIAAELLNILDLCPAPAIDRLIVVAYHH